MPRAYYPQACLTPPLHKTQRVQDIPGHVAACESEVLDKTKLPTKRKENRLTKALTAIPGLRSQRHTVLIFV